MGDGIRRAGSPARARIKQRLQHRCKAKALQSVDHDKTTSDMTRLEGIQKIVIFKMYDVRRHPNKKDGVPGIKYDEAQNIQLANVYDILAAQFSAFRPIPT